MANDKPNQKPHTSNHGSLNNPIYKSLIARKTPYINDGRKLALQSAVWPPSFNMASSKTEDQSLEKRAEETARNAPEIRFHRNARTCQPLAIGTHPPLGSCAESSWCAICRDDEASRCSLFPAFKDQKNGSLYRRFLVV